MATRSENIVVENEKGETLYESAFQPIPISTPDAGGWVVVPNRGNNGQITRRQGEVGWTGGTEMQIVTKKIALHGFGSFTHVLTVREPPATTKEK